MDPFDSGGVCRMGPYFEYGVSLVYIEFQIGPYWGLHGEALGMSKRASGRV